MQIMQELQRKDAAARVELDMLVRDSALRDHQILQVAAEASGHHQPQHLAILIATQLSLSLHRKMGEKAPAVSVNSTPSMC